ncbi:MAG: hypothetical protein ACXADC_14540, partial [Candidatus Thorarchaeota archaeon]
NCQDDIKCSEVSKYYLHHDISTNPLASFVCSYDTPEAIYSSALFSHLLDKLKRNPKVTESDSFSPPNLGNGLHKLLNEIKRLVLESSGRPKIEDA